MMPNKGTVIQVFRGRAVIMTDRCEYREIKINRFLQPGDQVEYSPGDIIRERQYPVKTLSLVASLLICCLIAFGVFQHMLAARVYAYIGLDINPSLEIAIDKDYRVVSVAGFNDDGNKVIQNSSLSNTGLDQALQVIIQNCRDGNYLKVKQPNYIAVSLCTPGEAVSRELLAHLDGVLTKALADRNVDARVYYFRLDEDTRDRALKNKVSPARYLLWTEAGKRGFSPLLEEVSLRDPQINSVAGEIEEKFPGLNKSAIPGPLTVPAENPPPAAEKSLQQDKGEGEKIPVRQGQGQLPGAGTGTGTGTNTGAGEGAGGERITGGGKNDQSKSGAIKQPVGPTQPAEGPDGNNTGADKASPALVIPEGEVSQETGATGNQGSPAVKKPPEGAGSAVTDSSGQVTGGTGGAASPATSTGGGTGSTSGSGGSGSREKSY
ncbi:MAG: anti-sigma factor domain-containing protein [Bacillota bacterium]